jgi:hypothetical protein
MSLHKKKNLKKKTHSLSAYSFYPSIRRLFLSISFKKERKKREREEKKQHKLPLCPLESEFYFTKTNYQVI